MTKEREQKILFLNNLMQGRASLKDLGHKELLTRIGSAPDGSNDFYVDGELVSKMVFNMELDKRKM